MVQIVGKRSRLVPILIMPAIKRSMDVLLRLRQQHNLMRDNKFFFASDSLNGCLDHCKVLRTLSVSAGLRNPELIRSTRLRKYMATVSQVCLAFNLFFLL
jgi:hypothetical protein